MHTGVKRRVVAVTRGLYPPLESVWLWEMGCIPSHAEKKFSLKWCDSCAFCVVLTVRFNFKLPVASLNGITHFSKSPYRPVSPWLWRPIWQSFIKSLSCPRD